jgi:hypothetical protein
MSDIFYSQVDGNLQEELNARGRSGRYSRTTRDLQFMLEKIANVQLIPFSDNERTKQIDAAILGGNTVRTGEYLPSGPNGYVSDRTYTTQENTIANGQINQGTVSPQVNSSRRIPPYISSCDITIGDNSNGLLNNATINIIIPNPERDLNFIESVYFRPGRACNVIIEHPETAVVGDNKLLTDETLPSTIKLAELYPNVFNVDELKSKYGKLNSIAFDGIITSFTFDYQLDMSIQATITLTGTSNIYTDISLIIDSNAGTDLIKLKNKETIKSNPINLKNFGAKSTLTNPYTKPKLNPVTVDPNAFKNYSTADDPIGTIFSSFYEKLNQEVQETIDFNETGKPRSEAEKRGFTAEYKKIQEIQQAKGSIWAAWGPPYKNAQYYKYITLGWLIDFINRVIITKVKGLSPEAKVVCTAKSDLCVSTFYEYLTSCNPERVFFPKTSESYGDLEWYSDTDSYTNLPTCIRADDNNETRVMLPTNFFINMEVIQEIVKSLQEQQNFTLSAFLTQISNEIYDASGRAIYMKLITHPEIPNCLLFYDVNKVSFDTKVKPYAVPMFANHKYGTVIRDFKFSAKLPSDASSLAYVVSQDPSEIAESDIAPYVAFMYTANTIERTGPHEVISNGITQADLDKINKIYKDSHKKYLKQYIEALVNFGNKPTLLESRTTLRDALEKHIQYPTETIKQSNQLNAPVIPFDVEFTIDGVNGFRYGDVLTFDALPTRYKRNAVFSIVSIVHTVGSDGQWTTTVRCIMRPAID